VDSGDCAPQPALPGDQGGEIAPAPAAGPRAVPPILPPVRAHDFLKPRILSEETLRALDAIHRKLARSVSEALSVLARARVECHLSLIGQREYFDFLRSLQSPTHLTLVQCLPERLPMVLEMSPAILFPMIERLLGGKGEGALAPPRPLTRIEQGLARSIAQRFLAVLGEAWSAVPDLRFDTAETEHNPLLMQIVGPGEISAILTFHVGLGTRAGTFQLCLPLKHFEPLLAQVAGFPGSSGGDPAGAGPAAALSGRAGTGEREKILRRVSACEVSLSAELASIPIALSDILALRPGDVIDTELSRGAEVSVLVDGRRILRGLAALHQGRRAVKVTRVDSDERRQDRRDGAGSLGHPGAGSLGHPGAGSLGHPGAGSLGHPGAGSPGHTGGPAS
jgi:flagellar motor switch protein FliM